MRVLFASTRGAGHFNPLVPFIEACVRGWHEVMVAGPPPLAPTVEHAGYPFWEGAQPPEDELGATWGRVATVSPDEANAIVIGEIFGGLNVRAMLPSLRAACEEWRRGGGDGARRSRLRARGGGLAAEMAALAPTDDALGAVELTG